MPTEMIWRLTHIALTFIKFGLRNKEMWRQATFPQLYPAKTRASIPQQRRRLSPWVPNTWNLEIRWVIRVERLKHSHTQVQAMQHTSSCSTSGSSTSVDQRWKSVDNSVSSSFSKILRKRLNVYFSSWTIHRPKVTFLSFQLQNKLVPRSKHTPSQL